MSDAQPNPRITQYDAPELAPDGFLRRVLCIPIDDDYRIVAAVNDVIGYLTRPGVFAESDNVSDIDMQALMTEMFLGYFGELEVMIGAVVPMVTDILPSFMVWCEGQTLLRSNYPDLYGRLHSAFIIDADSFTVPDLRAQFIFGSDDATYNVGDTGGEAEHELTVGELPAHHHAHDPVVVGDLDVESVGIPQINAAQIIPAATENTYDTGDNEPHNNMPPFIVLRYAMVAKWRDGC